MSNVRIDEIIDWIKNDEAFFLIGAGFSSSDTKPCVGTGKNIAQHLLGVLDPQMVTVNKSSIDAVYTSSVQSGNNVDILKKFLWDLVKKENAELKTICDKLFIQKGPQTYKRIIEEYFDTTKSYVLDSHASAANLINKIKQVGATYPLFVSLNIDRLIERAYSIQHPGEFLQTFIGGRATSDYSLLRNSPLWKIHGCWSNMDSIVFNSHDYFKIRNNTDTLDEMRKLLRDKHCILMGVSLQDEHITDIIYKLVEGFNIHQAVIVSPTKYLDKDLVDYMNKFIRLSHYEEEFSVFLDTLTNSL